MHQVSQITDYSCFLACLESFLKDNCFDYTQESMIINLSGKGICHENGFVPLDMMKAACAEYHVNIEEIPFHYPIERQYCNGSLLIGKRINGEHCVRFVDQKEVEKLIVMDPKSGEMMFYDKWLFDNAAFFKLSVSFHGKVEVINRHIHSLFSGNTIRHRSSAGEPCEWRIDLGKGETRSFDVDYAFVDDNNILDIISTMNKWNLKQELNKCNSKERVVVSSTGLTIVPCRQS